MEFRACLAALFSVWWGLMSMASTAFFLFGFFSKKPWTRWVLILLAALGFFLATVRIWTVEHRARLAAESSPSIVFDYKNERGKYIQAPSPSGERDPAYGTTWRVSIGVNSDKPVEGANVYVTRLTKTGNPSFDIRDEQQIGWNRGTDSFKPQTINGDNLQIVAFEVFDDGKQLILFCNKDNILAEYNRARPLSPGTYHITFQVEAPHGVSHKESYSLFWDGSMSDFPNHYHMEKIQDQK